MFVIDGSVWENGTKVASYDLADGAQLSNEREASQLLNSYIISLVIGGGVASYYRPHDEFKVVMPDGKAEYIKPPREV